LEYDVTVRDLNNNGLLEILTTNEFPTELEKQKDKNQVRQSLPEIEFFF
jgi:hypothetical protein